MSHIQAVLSTDELLEAILLQLDMQTLVTSANRVCKQWLDVLNTSPYLQMELYYRPELAQNAPRRMNPLLKKLFPPWFDLDDVSSDSFMKTIDGRRSFEELELYRVGLHTNDNPFLRREATWKKMLVAQPPIQTLGVYTQISMMHGRRSKASIKSYKSGTKHGSETDSATSGLRMGEFYSIAMQNTAYHIVSGFIPFWKADGTTHESFLQQVCPKDVDNMAKVSDKAEDLFTKDVEAVLGLYWTVQCSGEGMSDEMEVFWSRCGLRHGA